MSRWRSATRTHHLTVFGIMCRSRGDVWKQARRTTSTCLRRWGRGERRRDLGRVVIGIERAVRAQNSYGPTQQPSGGGLPCTLYLRRPHHHRRHRRELRILQLRSRLPGFRRSIYVSLSTSATSSAVSSSKVSITSTLRSMQWREEGPGSGSASWRRRSTS